MQINRLFEIVYILLEKKSTTANVDTLKEKYTKMVHFAHQEISH